MSPLSMNPKTFAEGGAVPVDRNLTWVECRFNLFDYTTKSGEIVATTVAAAIKYVDDDKNEYTQQYSVGDPARFTVSEDGKTLESDATPSKSSNFYLLINALFNCGAPETILDAGDISVLDGLKTHNIGLPEPKRSGLARTPAVEGQPVRERVISVPDQIITAPWDKAGKGKTTGKGKAAAAGNGDADEVNIEPATLAFVATVIGAGDTITRQALAQRMFKDLAKDPNRDAIAKFIFKPEFTVTMLSNGYDVDGDNISKPE